MKFIHAADIHLDSPLQSLVLQDQAQLTRMRRACRDAFERLVDFSIEQQVAFVLLAGDLYDHNAPNMQTAVFLRTQLARLEKNGIRVVIVKGNHDADNKITSALALPANTRILSDRKPETVLFDDLPVRVAIHGQSFKGGPVSENLAASYPAAKPGYVNIGILHTSLSGDIEHDAYAPCKLEDLTTRGYDYWALGHIHKGAKLLDDPWIVYPGNLQGRHAKETGPKGCMLVEVDDDRISTVELVDLAVVRWELAVADLKGKTREADLVEAIRAALAQAYKAADSRLTAVRLILAGETPLHDAIERRPSRLLQTVLELAAEIGGDDIWIEKIRNDTVRPLIAPKSQVNETANDLTQIMEEVASDTEQVNVLLQKELEPLRTKLPEELKELPALKLLDDPSLVLSALARLRPRLTSRLAGEEDA
jgi:DNA repair exonuclease SbcCD nuclease subunit